MIFRFSCSDQALDYLSTHGEGSTVLKSPSLDVEWTEDGSFASKDFIPRFPLMFNAFLRQVAFERENIARFSPGWWSLTRGSLQSLQRAAESYPVITMLNQFKVSFPPRFSGKGVGRLYERFAGDVLGLLWSLSDEVLMTDLPPPYTIGEANLAGTDVSNIVRYVGFTSPEARPDRESVLRAKAALDIDDRPLAFFQISGPDVTKRRFVDTVIQSTDILAQRYNVVVSMGHPSGSGEPRKLANGAWIYDWCPVKDELFALSSLVVARAGHRTIGQCIDAGEARGARPHPQPFRTDREREQVQQARSRHSHKVRETDSAEPDRVGGRVSGRPEVLLQHREVERDLQEVQWNPEVCRDRRLLCLGWRRLRGERLPFRLDVVDYLAALEIEPEPVLDEPQLGEGRPDAGAFPPRSRAS